MRILTSPSFLRAVLWADAASCAVCAALQLGAAGPMATLLGLPAPLLLGSGLVLLACAVLAAVLARRDPPPRAGVQVLAIGNFAWVAGCIALLVAGTAGTLAGQLYLLAQVVAVAVLAELEWFGAKGIPGILYASPSTTESSP